MADTWQGKKRITNLGLGELGLDEDQVEMVEAGTSKTKRISVSEYEAAGYSPPLDQLPLA